MTYNQVISKIIFFTIFIVAIVFLMYTYIIKSESIDNNLKTEKYLYSDLVFENLYTVMKNGGNTEEIKSLIHKLESKISNTNISIYKNLTETDQENVKQVFISKETTSFQHGNHIDFTKPILFENDCIKCHTTAIPGDIAAVLQVETPSLEFDISSNDILIFTLCLFISLSLIIFIVWYVYFRKVLIAPLEKMKNQLFKIDEQDDSDIKIDINTKIKELKDIEYLINKQALKLKESNSKLDKLCNIDSLTQVYNRRKFNDDIENLMIVCKRYNQIFSIISININNFKSINDTYGNNFGDMLLKEFSISIKKSIRQSDKLYRIAGDEFVLLLTHTKAIDSNVVIYNLREELSKMKMNINGDIVDITASFGISEYSKDIKTVEQLLVIADKEMYKDKLNIKQGF